jgi:16S rRNA U516 pseudouridylate synthase RsuA-like enzyme
MTAAVGFPTLRLIRVAIGRLDSISSAQGGWVELGPVEIRRIWQK